MRHPMTGFVSSLAFLRMIYVNTDPSVVMRPKGIYQALYNPLRKKNRNFEPIRTNSTCGFRTRGEVEKLIFRQIEKRVTATERTSHGSVGLDVFKACQKEGENHNPVHWKPFDYEYNSGSMMRSDR